MRSNGLGSDTTRRGLLTRSGAALAVTVGFAGCGSGTGGETTAGADGTTASTTGTTDAAETTETGSAASTTDPGTAGTAETPRNATATTSEPSPIVVELGAAAGGWSGRSPSYIGGERNPTLRLSPGETYDIRWVNLDGERHQLVLADADGTVVHSTTTSTERKSTRVLRFEATDRLATYRCEFHPSTMQGTVVTGSPRTAGRETTGTPDGTAGTGGTATGTPEPGEHTGGGNASRGSNRTGSGEAGTTAGSPGRRRIGR
jgi:hypothetical protein